MSESEKREDVPEPEMKFPLRPVPESEFGAGKAIATFGASALLGLGGLIFLAPVGHTRGATRSAQLKKQEMRRALDEAAAEEARHERGRP